MRSSPRSRCSRAPKPWPNLCGELQALGLGLSAAQTLELVAHAITESAWLQRDVGHNLWGMESPRRVDDQRARHRSSRAWWRRAGHSGESRRVLPRFRIAQESVLEFIRASVPNLLKRASRSRKTQRQATTAVPEASSGPSARTSGSVDSGCRLPRRRDRSPSAGVDPRAQEPSCRTLRSAGCKRSSAFVWTALWGPMSRAALQSRVGSGDASPQPAKHWRRASAVLKMPACHALHTRAQRYLPGGLPRAFRYEDIVSRRVCVISMMGSRSSWRWTRGSSRDWALGRYVARHEVAYRILVSAYVSGTKTLRDLRADETGEALRSGMSAEFVLNTSPLTCRTTLPVTWRVPWLSETTAEIPGTRLSGDQTSYKETTLSRSPWLQQILAGLRAGSPRSMQTRTWTTTFAPLRRGPCLASGKPMARWLRALGGARHSSFARGTCWCSQDRVHRESGAMRSQEREGSGNGR